MNPGDDVIEAWVDEAEEVALVTAGDRNAQGIGNMLAFVDVAAHPSDRVAATLLAIASVFEKKAAAAKACGVPPRSHEIAAFGGVARWRAVCEAPAHVAARPPLLPLLLAC